MKKNEKDSMNYDENGNYYDASNDSAYNGLAKTFEKILGILLLIWFGVTVILMIVLSQSSGKSNSWLIVILFFQLIAVFGIFGIVSELIKKQRFQAGLLLPLIIGAGGCIVTLLIHNSEGEKREFILKLLAVLFPLIFAVIGIGIIVDSLRAKYHTKKVCTEPITAKCVDVSTNSTTVNGRTTYKYVPTYEYEYDGVQYTSTAYKTPEDRIIGDNYEILVNPNKPKEIYDATSVDAGAASIVLTALFLIGLPAAISALAAYYLLIAP